MPTSSSDLRILLNASFHSFKIAEPHVTEIKTTVPEKVETMTGLQLAALASSGMMFFESIGP
jgi:hypothetical protein